MTGGEVKKCCGCHLWKPPNDGFSPSLILFRIGVGVGGGRGIIFGAADDWRMMETSRGSDNRSSVARNQAGCLSGCTQRELTTD